MNRCSLIDQFHHMAEEEGQQQSPDMGTIHIRIRHQDHPVIAEFGQVQITVNIGAQGGNQVPDFFMGQHFIRSGFFYVQNFTAQGQDGLETPVAALFGGTAGGFTFYQV